MSLKKIILLFVLQLGRRVLFGGVGFPYSWVSDSMDGISWPTCISGVQEV